MIDFTGYGRVAVVTGCASGIGLATTIQFLKHQYQVFGVDISQFDYKILDSLSIDGGSYQERFHFHRADLTTEGECDTAIRVCIAEFGERIDVLANVAGIMDTYASADTITDAQWDRVIATNLTVPTKMMRAVLPFMKAKKKGSIVNVGSKASMSGAAAGLAYTASKHGLLGATKHTAWRFKDEGIRCNAVLPGGVATGIVSSMNMELVDQDAYGTIKGFQSLHLSPEGLPEIQGDDVAHAVLFLASDEAKMINGASLPVDKAWSVV